MKRWMAAVIAGTLLFSGCGGVTSTDENSASEESEEAESTASSAFVVKSTPTEEPEVTEAALPKSDDYSAGTTDLTVNDVIVKIPSAWEAGDHKETMAVDGYWIYYPEQSAEFRIETKDTSLRDIQDEDDLALWGGSLIDDFGVDYDDFTQGSESPIVIGDVTALERPISGIDNGKSFDGKAVIYPTDSNRIMIMFYLLQYDGCEYDHTADFDKVIRSMAAPDVKSITAKYSGDTKPGTMIETGMIGIDVTAELANGNKDYIDSFDNEEVVVQNPRKLQSGTNTFTIEYGGQTCELLIGSQDEYGPRKYLVGQDIPAGQYILFADDGYAYMELTSDVNGNDIICNDTFSTNCIVTINNGEYLLLDDATAYEYDQWHQTNSLDTTKPGMFKVGTDLPAGRYTLVAVDDDTAYWDIFSDDRHSTVVGMENFEGQSYCEVSDGQYLELCGCKIQQ